MGKKTSRNLIGLGIFPGHSEYFLHAENLVLHICPTAFVDKIIRGNITYNIFHQLVVNMGNYMPQKGNVCENNLFLTCVSRVKTRVLPHFRFCHFMRPEIERPKIERLRFSDASNSPSVSKFPSDAIISNIQIWKS